MADVEKLVMYAAIAVGAYLLYRALTGASKAAGAALTSAQQGVSDTLTRVFDPNAGVASQVTSTDYVVVFPDGSRHAVNSGDVRPDGTFDYGGQTYQLVRGIAANAAVPVSSIVGDGLTSSGGTPSMTDALGY